MYITTKSYSDKLNSVGPFRLSGTIYEINMDYVGIETHIGKIKFRTNIANIKYKTNDSLIIFCNLIFNNETLLRAPRLNIMKVINNKIFERYSEYENLLVNKYIGKIYNHTPIPKYITTVGVITYKCSDTIQASKNKLLFGKFYHFQIDENNIIDSCISGINKLRSVSDVIIMYINGFDNENIDIFSNNHLIKFFIKECKSIPFIAINVLLSPLIYHFASIKFDTFDYCLNHINEIQRNTRDDISTTIKGVKKMLKPYIDTMQLRINIRESVLCNMFAIQIMHKTWGEELLALIREKIVEKHISLLEKQVSVLQYLNDNKN